MSELRPIVLGIGHGLKDSLLGTTVLLRLNSILEEKQTEDQFKTDTQSSRRTRLRGRQNDLDKKADRYMIRTDKLPKKYNFKPVKFNRNVS